MGLSSAALADILYYQRRGGDIRDYVARSLLDRERPLTVVGHSLGGVVLVDLLSSGSAPRGGPVGDRRLAGPALLRHRRPRAPPSRSRAAPFTPWLNIYNEADLLSFCAERVFPDNEGIGDFAVDARVPFPESHSAYWGVDEVFDAIKAAWPAAEAT